MRQGQQNRRGRGRNNNNNNGGNNNNRKSQNPLTRSFESTGPDVKVRGTPSHVAEKYISLARDALSSGDRVLAENYLQHAEHYNRIILTYREQQMSQGGEFQPGLPRVQTFNAQDPHDGEEFDDESSDDAGNVGQPQTGDREVQPQGGGNPQRQFEPQQRYDNRPQRHDNRNEHRQHNNQPRHDRDGNRFDRGDRHDNRGDHRFNRNDRGDRHQDRNQERHQDRNFDRNQGEPRDFRDDRGPTPFVEGQAGESHNGNGHRRRERFQPHAAPIGNGDRAPPPGFTAQPPMPVLAPVVAPAVPVQSAPPAALEAEQPPAFLRRPVRRPRREDPDAAGPAAAPRQPVADETE